MDAPRITPLGSPPPAASLRARLAALPAPVFLDSSLVAPPWGRFSILAAAPEQVLSGRPGALEHSGNGQRREVRSDPIRTLEALLAGWRCEPQTRLPFVGGALGYWSYDLGRRLAGIRPRSRPGVGLPELWWGLYPEALIVDWPAMQCWHVTRTGRQQLLGALDGPDPGPPPDPTTGPLVAEQPADGVRRRIARAIELILAGDIFQVNLSQRFGASLSGSPLALYERLCTLSPAPFAAYLGPAPGAAVLSISPERFIACRAGRIETCPIKGTRRRGATPAEDEAARRALLGSEKDRAELAMIVDLMRNDLGRVATHGSVEVTGFPELHSFRDVHHLVGRIEAGLPAELGLGELLRAVFPGGSITGAPKRRAMQIIEQLEPHGRSLYTGSIGYISCDGQLDWNIAIRTALVADGRLTVQTGGGIVADSTPVDEYQETLTKARSFMDLLA